jgi:hypothetical protein
MTKSKPCNTDCCKPEHPLDCCAVPYQRLEKLRNGWSSVAATGNTTLPQEADGANIVGPTTRGGAAIAAPVAEIFGSGSPSGLVTVSGSTITVLYNAAYYAYLFVNTHRYLAFQECGKLDQVVGWGVDFCTGQLQLYQDLCELNLTVADNRGYLINLNKTEITPVQRKQLRNLNRFYKLSKAAVAAVGSNQKEEGNIVEVTDKCGQRWLVAVNLPALNIDTCLAGQQFTFVAIKLC